MEGAGACVSDGVGRVGGGGKRPPKAAWDGTVGGGKLGGDGSKRNCSAVGIVMEPKGDRTEPSMLVGSTAASEGVGVTAAAASSSKWLEEVGEGAAASRGSVDAAAQLLVGAPPLP